jgi:hypothetical protein
VSDNNATNERVSVVSPCGNLTAYFLSATSSNGNFTGLFCVNANGDGTYVQYPSNPHTSGPGHVKKNQGVTTIQASGPTAREFSLVGQTNGTTSSYNETGYGLPRKTGTFTLVKGPA